MNGFISEFVIACLLMGVGIGIDAAIATSANSSMLKTRTQVTCWIGGLSLTHTLFPLIGYSLSYFGIQTLPHLTPLIGIIAFSFIFWFLFCEFRAMLIDDEDHKENAGFFVSLGVILAVSWDALWSGPAKSAQVVGWPESAVWLSFILVGIIVTILTTSAWWIGSRAVKNQKKNKDDSLVPLTSVIQYSVLAYFGILALARYSLNLPINDASVFLIATATTTVALFFVQTRKYKLIQARTS
ncbi:Uncharacterised protein [BD1-7 clade bacterium]|uniref:Manganese efflux pump MntP n=1 Tax=BD1-7 clade bacterium TaxID=2029982 RepID=A0A5S9Q207_9GAMM|nr:Uncharacterised protein [BD1-7 clade bacterium]CAA0112468.1 Uncharacterised protein [BD1-7 clade bacterium]